MGGHNHRLASGEPVTRSNVTGVPPLLQELFYHAQRDPEAPGNFRTRPRVIVVASKNPFPEIQ